MTEEEFVVLFEQALGRAAENAAQQLGRAIPRVFKINLYGADHSGMAMSPQDVLKFLYLGPSLFYRVIDLAVTAVTPSSSIVFVRVSGHAPGSFDETWNDPPGSGPFKQLLAQEVSLLDLSSPADGGARG